MKTKILVVFFLCFSFQFSFAQVAKSKNITTKQLKNLSSSNPNIGNGSEIIARADIKAMAESLVNLTIKNNTNLNNISRKEKLADIKAMAESLVNLTMKN